MIHVQPTQKVFKTSIQLIILRKLLKSLIPHTFLIRFRAFSRNGVRESIEIFRQYNNKHFILNI